jgi:hypothetical protein
MALLPPFRAVVTKEGRATGNPHLASRVLKSVDWKRVIPDCQTRVPDLGGKGTLVTD